MSINTKTSQVSGFYYDWQLSNPLLTATLHTNTRLIGIKTGNKTINKLEYGENPYEIKGKFEWELWKPKRGVTDSSEDTPETGHVYCLDPITNNYSLAYDENPSACYRAKPLITSILSEDFQVEVGNSWSDNGGQTGIESAFNSLKTLAPYKQETGAGFEALGKAIIENFGKKDKNGNPTGKGFANWVGNKAQTLGQALGSGADALNSTLIQQGTRFSYYGGTSTNFGNLSMRFTLFADWIWDDIEKDWVFKTVLDQLREIYPYTVGKYYPLKLGLNENILKDNPNSNLAGDIDETVGNFFGWQQPPAGFRADMRSLDTCQQGTLRLVLGGYYTAENLLISGMSVNFSKTMTKIPSTRFNGGTGSFGEYDKDDKGNILEGGKLKFISTNKKIDVNVADGGYLTPLYADVTITLRPASSYSDNTVINFSSNTGKGYINMGMEKMRRNLIKEQIDAKKTKQKQIESLLNDLKDDNKPIKRIYSVEVIDETYEEEPPLPKPGSPSSQYNTGQDLA